MNTNTGESQEKIATSEEELLSLLMRAVARPSNQDSEVESEIERILDEDQTETDDWDDDPNLVCDLIDRVSTETATETVVG